MSTQEGQTEWNAATGSSAREAPDHNHRAPASRPDPEGTQSAKGAVSWMLWDRPVRPMSTSGGPQDRQGHSQSLAHHHLQRIWAQHSSLAPPAAQTDQSRGHVDRPSALLCQRGPAEFTELPAIDSNISSNVHEQRPQLDTFRRATPASQVTPPTVALEPAREHHLTWAHAPRKILTPPFSQDLQHPDLEPGRWRELALSRLRTPSLLQTYARFWSRLSARSWEERVCRDLDPGLFKSGRM